MPKKKNERSFWNPMQSNKWSTVGSSWCGQVTCQTEVGTVEMHCFGCQELASFLFRHPLLYYITSNLTRSCNMIWLDAWIHNKTWCLWFAYELEIYVYSSKFIFCMHIAHQIFHSDQWWSPCSCQPPSWASTSHFRSIPYQLEKMAHHSFHSIK